MSYINLKRRILIFVALLLILQGSMAEKTSADWMNISATFFSQGNEEIALQSIGESLELDPGNPEAWINKGQILSGMKQWEKAIGCYDKAIELDPLVSDAWYNKGFALDELDQYQKAFECYDTATILDPRNWRAWNRKGIALRNLGRSEEAIESYEKAIVISPKFAPAWSNKVIALSYLERYEEALYCSNRTIEIRSKNREYLSQAYIDKGLVLMLLKRPDDAIACFDEAINESIGERRIWTAWFSKGVALKSMGKYALAESSFDKAREQRLGGDPRALLMKNLKNGLGM